MEKNIFDNKELLQLKQKNEWLCNFALENIQLCKEAQQQNLNDLSCVYKAAVVFTVMKIVDISNHLASRLNKKGSKDDDIEFMESFKTFVDSSIGFDNFNNDILFENIKEMIISLILPLCEEVDSLQQNTTSFVDWGQELNLKKTSKKKTEAKESKNENDKKIAELLSKAHEPEVAEANVASIPVDMNF